MKNRNAVPIHLAIIMDGNGRWAQERGLPRTAGHQAGIKAVRRAVEASVELSIEALTLYTFSTENWNRPRTEVLFLMKLLERYAISELPELQKQGIRLRFLGRREGLSHSMIKTLDRVTAETAGNSNLNLNLALNYGSRAEIIDAARAIVTDYRYGHLDIERLDVDTVSRYLYTADLPDPDLLIRTGGEHRLSNFLLWQAVGSVFLTIPIMWPDFNRDHLQGALKTYHEQTDSWDDEDHYGNRPRL